MNKFLDESLHYQGFEFINRVLNFGVDADFNFCIDGLVLVDMAYLK
ncbi:hypothetical protein [Amphritea sp. HPY]